jgi:superfamily II DNA or RNA helicase
MGYKKYRCIDANGNPLMRVSIDYNKKNSICILNCEDISILNAIREKFSVPNRFAAFQSRFAPRKLYSITPAGKFEPGLINDVVECIKEYSDLIKITFTDEMIDYLNSNFDRKLSVLENNLKLHYYQEEILKKALTGGRGICVLGTGGGKTLTIATLIYNIFKYYKENKNFKCLLLVPDRGLVQQTYSDFIEYKVPFTFCRWTAEYKLDQTVNVVIASNQIIQSQFEDQEWAKYVDILVIDECHRIKGQNKIGKLIKKIYTTHKFGFTGTLPDEKMDEWSIKGKIGPVYYEKRGNELRDEGFLTNAEVKIIKVEYNSKPRTSFTDEEFTTTARYKAELDFLYESSFRNNIIKKICHNFNNNILILVNHIRHGEILLEALSAITDREVFFVQGSVEVDDREKIKQQMEEKSNVICVAMSSIFSTGINIKNIHMIVFASGGKAFIRLVQSIGRGLRKHHTKEKLLILDIADMLKYGEDHHKKRVEIYRKENIPFSITQINESKK